MKPTIQKTLVVFFFFVIALSCETSEPVPLTPGSVKFGWTEKDLQGGRTKDGEEPKSILVSIKDAEGQWVHQLQKLSLYKFGEGYVSENLQLIIGSYQLIEFLVLDDEDNIIYATPVQGSELADLVEQPLPVGFEITDGGNTPLIVQVLAVTEEDDPESFGYVSFGFEIVDQPIDQQLKAIWIDDGSEPQYRHTNKIHLNYIGNRLMSAIDFAQSGADDDWHLLDSMTFKYTDDGKLSEKNIFDVTSPANSYRYTYQYNQEGKLHRMTQSSGGLAAASEIEFTYDQDGHIKRAVTSSNSYLNYEYEFETDSSGNVLRRKKFILLGATKRLQFEYSFTYNELLKDPSANIIGLLNFDFRNSLSFGPNNIESYRSSFYNGSTENFLCENTIQYTADDKNRITMALFNDAENCVNSTNNDFEDGTRFTFIYE